MPRKSRANGLAEVAAAIGARDFPRALAEALGEWRHARCTVLADLVEAIAARCRPAPIAGRTAVAFHMAWMQLAESKPSPVAVGALATALGKNIPVAKTRNYVDRDIRRYKAFLDRIAALERLPHDPRIATAIVSILERAPWSIESGRRIYQPAVDLAVDTTDERSVPRLRAIVQQPTSKHALVRAYFAEALPVAAGAIEKRDATVFSNVDRTLATQLIATLAQPKNGAGRDVEQLLAEVFADPDDDSARAVLADALLERDDPRGEFITLQLRGTLDATQRKRIGSLLRQHEQAWLGDLAFVTKHRVWRRGFLDEAELARNASAGAATWDRAAADPRLATLRRLDKGAANATHYQNFVLSPHMRGLREVTALSVTMLEALADRRLDTIVVETSSLDNALDALGGAIERTGATRIVFVYNLWPGAMRELVPQLRNRERVRELCARPFGGNASAWRNSPWAWINGHAQLRAPELSVELDDLHIVAEARGKKVLFEIDGDDDNVVEALIAMKPRNWVLTDRGRTRRAGRP